MEAGYKHGFVLVLILVYITRLINNNNNTWITSGAIQNGVPITVFRFAIVSYGKIKISKLFIYFFPAQIKMKEVGGGGWGPLNLSDSDSQIAIDCQMK